jgi:hypothetical protein
MVQRYQLPEMCAFVYVCVWLYVCVLGIWTHVCVSKTIHGRERCNFCNVNKCMYVCMYVWMYVCMYSRSTCVDAHMSNHVVLKGCTSLMYTSMYLRQDIHTWMIPEWLQKSTQIYLHTNNPRCIIYIYTWMHTHTHTPAYKWSQTHYTDINMNAHTHTCIQITPDALYTHTHECTHTHTHLHTNDPRRSADILECASAQRDLVKVESSTSAQVSHVLVHVCVVCRCVWYVHVHVCVWYVDACGILMLVFRLTNPDAVHQISANVWCMCICCVFVY